VPMLYNPDRTLAAVLGLYCCSALLYTSNRPLAAVLGLYCCTALAAVRGLA
jgi:hypothetical protein